MERDLIIEANEERPAGLTGALTQNRPLLVDRLA
jgi:hypothetical protein